MATQDAPILIIYNHDTTSITGQRDQQIAVELEKHLLKAQKKPSAIIVRGFNENLLATVSYQWLIVVNPEAAKGNQKKKLEGQVQTALQQVIDRKKRGVLAVTIGSPNQESIWRTVRQYDLNDAENNAKIVDEAFNGILHATQYAKLPLSQAKQPTPAQFMNNIFSPIKTVSNKTLAAIALILLLILLVSVTAISYTMPTLFPSLLARISHPSPKGTTSTTTPSLKQDDAATQTAKAATQTAIHATQTATAPQPITTIDTSAPEGQLYADTIKKLPTITGFQKKDNWGFLNSSSGDIQNPLCNFDQASPKTTYHAVSKVANTYTPCLAQSTNLKNFVYQVSMTINNNGYAGGVVFRDDSQGDYYRFALEKTDQSYEYTVFYCHTASSQICLDQEGEGDQLGGGSVPDTSLIPDQPITLVVIAQNNDIYFYVNRHFLTQVTSDASKLGTKTTQAGWIGVLAASPSADNGNTPQPTDVTFSNLKVWDLGAQ